MLHGSVKMQQSWSSRNVVAVLLRKFLLSDDPDEYENMLCIVFLFAYEASENKIRMTENIRNDDERKSCALFKVIGSPYAMRSTRQVQLVIWSKTFLSRDFLLFLEMKNNLNNSVTVLIERYKLFCLEASSIIRWRCSHHQSVFTFNPALSSLNRKF